MQYLKLLDGVEAPTSVDHHAILNVCTELMNSCALRDAYSILFSYRRFLSAKPAAD